MQALPATERGAAAIREAAWWVRHYRRGARLPAISGPQRAQAIQRLGLAVRHAFNESDDFELLLRAVLEGLSPRDDPPPF
jgi:hypothetical protein